MDGDPLCRLFVVHQLGCQFLAGRPGHEEAQKKLGEMLVDDGGAEEEREIAFFYLVLAPSSELSAQSRRAIIEYAADPAHGDVAAQKASARSIVKKSVWDVLERMRRSHASRR